MSKFNLFLICFLIIAFIIGCNQNASQQAQMNEEITNANMKLTSPAFQNHEAIPLEFTCEGSNLNPPLMISGAPENAKSIALIAEDPDAVVGTFVHWVAWNIPPETKEIKKGTEPGAKGKGSSGKLGYIGPCPPSGTHRYFFKLYALDTKLDLPEGSSKKEIEKAMQGHILAQAQLMGTYKKANQ